MEEKVYNPDTGEELHRDIRPVEFEFKGKKFVVKMSGWFPAKGDDGIFTKEDRKAYNKALNKIKAEVEKLMSPEEIRATRKQLQLTQRQAGEILGGGKNAFQKYESGEILPSKAISNLLKVLSINPKLMEVIK